MHLATDRLTKRYDNFELSLPNFHVESGTAVGLGGNNGAGKTIFLRLALDLICAGSGTSCSAASLVSSRDGSDSSFRAPWLRAASRMPPTTSSTSTC